MRTLAPVIVGLTTLFSGIASAISEESDAKLPANGAWARYHAVTKRDTGDEAVGTMILKSLTSTKTGETACRWLESEYLADEGKNHQRRKFLIPERAMQSSEKPSDDVVKYLQRDDTDAVTSVPPEGEGWMPVDFLYFPGFLKNASVVDDQRLVKHQTGALEIPKAYVGTYKWWRKGRLPEETTVWQTQYRVWLHPDLPIGFAHAKAKLTVIRMGQEVRSWDLEYALNEFGGNAQPAIAEESAPPIRP
jgi:hypothetical protein